MARSEHNSIDVTLESSQVHSSVSTRHHLSIFMILLFGVWSCTSKQDVSDTVDTKAHVKFPELRLALQINDTIYFIHDNVIILDKKKLLDLSSIIAVVVDSTTKDTLEVDEFALSGEFEGRVWKAIAYDERITEKQRDIIHMAVRGTKLYLEDVKLKNSQSSVRMAPMKAIHVL